MRFLDQTEEQKRDIITKTYSHEAMVDYLTNFFKGVQDQKLKKKSKISEDQQKKKGQLILLCLDNATQLIEHEKEVFLDFLTTLYEECHNLRIIITLSVTLGVLPNNERPCS